MVAGEAGDCEGGEGWAGRGCFEGFGAEGA